MAIQDLYDEDFVAWTREQAEALRAAGRSGGRSNAVDWDRVAEEIEDVGKSEYRAATSYVLQILAHLYKLAWSERDGPKGGWRGELIQFRAALKRTLTPSLRNRIAEEMDELHIDAGKIADAAFAAHEPEAARDPSLRWTLDDVLSGDKDPET